MLFANYIDPHTQTATALFTANYKPITKSTTALFTDQISKLNNIGPIGYTLQRTVLNLVSLSTKQQPVPVLLLALMIANPISFPALSEG